MFRRPYTQLTLQSFLSLYIYSIYVCISLPWSLWFLAIIRDEILHKIVYLVGFWQKKDKDFKQKTFHSHACYYYWYCLRKIFEETKTKKEIFSLFFILCSNNSLYMVDCLFKQISLEKKNPNQNDTDRTLSQKRTQCSGNSCSVISGPAEPNALPICTWFLKNQVGKIKFNKLDF